MQHPPSAARAGNLSTPQAADEIASPSLCWLACVCKYIKLYRRASRPVGAGLGGSPWGGGGRGGGPRTIMATNSGGDGCGGWVDRRQGWPLRLGMPVSVSTKEGQVLEVFLLSRPE